jgi:hypothetical protein
VSHLLQRNLCLFLVEGRSNAYDGEDIEIEANADECHSSPCNLCIVSSFVQEKINEDEWWRNELSYQREKS